MASSSHSMIFATGEAACAVDREGTIVAWNTAASSTFGYPESRAIGAKCWDLLRGKDTFGNRYCGERCPLREMALQRQCVNRCKLSFRTAHEGVQVFRVTTIALFDTPDALLIHLCRKELADRRDRSGARSVRDGATRSDHCLLTPREQQVLRHLSDGHSTREIATLLRISVPTVRNHVEHILHKLRVHSRLEAVAVSRRLGLN